MYFRIFASNYLPHDLERILYLDADTIVINPLKELYETMNMKQQDLFDLACVPNMEYYTGIIFKVYIMMIVLVKIVIFSRNSYLQI